MPFQTPTLLIGVSARIYHPAGPVLDLGGVWTKTLHYLEQSVAQLLVRCGALPLMIPAVDAQSVVKRADLHLGHYARALDGLVLQGGNDVAPQSYGETPLDPAWAGDLVRDRYEMELINAFVEAGKPVFGICRGLQVLNVNFGGTLYQDIATQLPEATLHVNRGHYERNVHAVRVEAGTRLAEICGGAVEATVNSIHHQGIKELAPDFVVEARCPADGFIEAVRRRGAPWVAAVQWHPEFHEPGSTGTFDDNVMLRDFLDACRAARTVDVARRAPKPRAKKAAALAAAEPGPDAASAASAATLAATPAVVAASTAATIPSAAAIPADARAPDLAAPQSA